ncbi:MAG: hypothetical protein EP329_00365 [Deltaproteobacteria bacterium]|nr:MAG: hypothetical protein EP329_00365 [Deltaproteobacteria bacterium]
MSSRSIAKLLSLAVLLSLSTGCGQTDEGKTVYVLGDASDAFIARKLKVLSIEPAEGPLSGGQLVAMTGTGFQAEMTVTFGGEEALKVIVGGDELAIMRTPSGLEPGPVDVTVTLPDERTTTVTKGYSYLPDAEQNDLVVIGVTPGKGPVGGGDLAVIEGRGFIDGAKVFFGGVPASGVRVLGVSAITCEVPPGLAVGKVDVRVETPEIAGQSAAQDTLLDAYEYLPEDTVSPDDLLVLGTIPSEGPLSGGTLVTVRGQGFEEGAKVFFGGAAATNVQVLGAHAISVEVPPGAVAGSVDVRVELPAVGGVVGDAHTLPDGYQYIDDTEPLLVLQVLPSSGPLEGGNLVAISGQSFEPGATVYFGGAPATEVNVLAGTAITCRVPAGASPDLVDIRVELPGVDGAPGAAHTLHDGYEYLDETINPDQLLVLSALPSTGPLAGGNLVTISGQGFAPGATVYFGGAVATEVSVLGNGAITCKAPVGAEPGLVNVRVELATGASHTLQSGYEYLTPDETGQLLVLNAIPATGPMSGGNVVTLAGQGFTAGATVWIGGSPATQVNVLGPTALTCVAPTAAQAGAVDVRVELPGGDAHTLVQGYTYWDDSVTPDTLLVLGVIPASGPMAGGNVVTIAGQAFAAGAQVQIGGVAATQVQVLGSNAITCVAPASSAAGPADVRVQLPGGDAHTLADAYTYVDSSVVPDPLVITSVIPATGPTTGGNVVALAGSGFAAGARVFFGTSQATQVQVLGSTALTCIAPNAATPGLVSVRVELPAAAGQNAPTYTLPDAYTYVTPSGTAAELAILGVTPAEGPLSGGNVVAISGTGFAAGALVYFDGVAATAVQVLGTTAITCQAPPGVAAGLVDVRVELSDGGAKTLPNGYTYYDDAVPPVQLLVLEAIPDSGPLSGGTTVALSGQGFVAGMTVFFGGVQATDVQVLADSALTCTLPNGVAAGNVDVRVQLPGQGGDAHTLYGGFTYIDDTVAPDALLVLATIPTEGPLSGGNTVTVAGTGFVAGATVWFGGVQATQVQVLAPEALTCKAPAGVSAGAVDVRVQLPGDGGDAATLVGGYEYVDDTVAPDPLRVLSVIPTEGPVTGGNVVAIQGTGFEIGALVYFGGAAATQVQVLGPTAITCRAPAGAAAGTVNVRVELAGGTGDAHTLFDAYTYTPVDQTPLGLATVYPIDGPVEGGELVLLTGTGFDAAMSVRFGGVPSPLVQVLGPSSATALTPAHVEGLVDVVLINPDATQANLPGAYRYLADAVANLEDGPALGGVVPARGPTTGGSIVRVIGDNFAPTLRVWFGDTEAAEVQVLSPSAAAVRLPPGAAGAVRVTVQNPDGQEDQLAAGFTYVTPGEDQPVIDEIWPAMGPNTGGTWVVVDGAAFAAQSTVWFGLTPAAQTRFVDDGRLIAVSPPGETGVTDLTVVRPDGAYVRLDGAFAYYAAGSLPSSPPVIGNVFPATGSIDGGQQVSLVGSDFAQGARVFFGSTEAAVVNESQTSQRIVVSPAHATGAVEVTLVNPDGLTHSKANAYVYFAPPPLIKGVTPDHGGTSGGYTVTLEGKNLRPDSTVLFGTHTITAFNTATPTALTFFAPPNLAGPVDVTVTNPDGQLDTDAGAFTYIQDDLLDDPVLTAIEPTTGPSTGGYIALLRGQNFFVDAEVDFDGVPALATEWLADDLLKVLVPPGVPNTTVDVTVSNTPFATATLSQAFTYQSAVVAPLNLYSVSPGVGPTTGGTVITLAGDGFTEGMAVLIGGTAATTVDVLSPTSATAVTPPGTPGLVSVRVERPDLSAATAYNAFAYITPSDLANAPRVTNVEPHIGPLTGNALVLVSGERFASPVRVFFGTNEAPVATFIDSGRIAVRTPPRADIGTVAVSVINADGLVGVLPGGYAYYDATGATGPDVFIAQPAQGSTFGGESVNVIGNNMQAGARAYICERPAQASDLVGDSQLTVLTPAHGPGACTITIVNPDGLTGDRNEAFEYVSPAPEVTGVIPATGPKDGGIDVVVQGNNFVSGATVRFGLATSPTVIVADPHTLTARLPANNVGTVTVTVINPGASQQSGSLTDAFTYVDQVNGQPPVITDIYPASGPLQGGTPVTIRGSNFDPAALVIFDNGILQNAQVFSDTEIRLTTPARDQAGTVAITVLNPDGLGHTIAAGFTYAPPTAPAPIITTVVPSTGPEAGGNTLTITGQNFLATGSWTLGGQPLLSAATITQSLVTARAPAHLPGKVDLTYVGPDGQVAVLAAAYEYLAAPVLTNVAPGLGGIEGDTEVTLIGNNFVQGMEVFFGGVAGNVLVIGGSGQTATARTPPRPVGGFVDVLVKNPDGQGGTLVDGFEYLDLPDVVEVWPPTGPNTGATMVQVRGAGFHKLSEVWFGTNQAARVVYSSPTLLLAVSPAATVSSIVEVRVVNPDGNADSLPDGFTYTHPDTLGPAPAITEMFPLAGPTTGGTRVGLSGLNFSLQGQAIMLPSVAQTAFIRSDRAILVAPPHPIGESEVYWVNPDGQTVRSASNFVYIDPATVGPNPQISTFSPDAGPTAGGQQVTLVGLNFQTNARVRFGPDDGIAVDHAATAMTVRTPARSKGSVEVWVVNPDGSQVVSTDTYLYMAPPTILSITPSTGPASGGTTMTISGADFLEDPAGILPTIIYCNSYTAGDGCVPADPADVTVSPNGRTITVKTPAHPPHLVDVAVVAPDGQDDYTPVAFTFTEIPTLTDITPDAGPTAGGQTVTLTGTGFQLGVKIYLDSAPCTDVNVSSSTSLTCKTPAGSTGTADVVIINPDGGNVTIDEIYTYLAPPVLTKAVPNLAPEGDTTVETTLTGSNFSPQARVFFDTTEATILSITATTIRVKVPALAGSVDIVVRNPDGQESRLIDGFSFIPPLPPPTALYITPKTGLTYGGDSFKVAGANFLDGAIVEFGDSATGDWTAGLNLDTRNNGTLIVGTTPTHDLGLVDVRITNSDGQSVTLADAFEFVPPPEEQPLSVINIEPARSVVQGGGWITIAGTGFHTNITIKFNQESTTVSALDVQRLGPTLMRARVPPAPVGPGPAVLIVTNPATPTAPAETYLVENFFEYLAGPVFLRHPGDRLPNEPTNTDAVLIFDANGDGLNDVLIGRYNADDEILINGYQGRAGNFSKRTFHGDPTNYHRTKSLQAYDFDSDGDLDVLRHIDKAGYGYDYLEFCRNDGGEFSCWAIFDPGSSGGCRFRGVQIGDLNCDGYADIFIPRDSTSGSCRNYILEYVSGTRFRGITSVLPDDIENTRGAAIGDVDGDGDNDIIFANDSSTFNRLYLNNCADLQLAGECEMIPADFPAAVYNNHTYFRSNFGATWDESRAFCQRHGGDLVVIDDADEANFVRYDPINGNAHLWLGLWDPDADNANYEWISPPSGDSYYNWRSGQPNSASEQCVFWEYNSYEPYRRYSDAPCSNGYNFECETDHNVCGDTWSFGNVQYGTTFPLAGGNSTDVVFLDVNDDGLLDAFVSNYAEPSRLYMNTGGTTGGQLFVDESAVRWPAESPSPRLYRLKAIDLDDDSDTDIVGFVWTGDRWEVRLYINDRYVQSYKQFNCDPDIEDCSCHPKVDSCETVIAEGTGIFSDLTTERWGPDGDPADMRTDPSSLMNPFDVGDLDGDGLADVYISGYTFADRMVMNDGYERGLPWIDTNRLGAGFFRFNTYRAMPERRHGSNDSVFGDVNGDGLPDLVTCGYGQPLLVYVNDGAGKYIDVSDQSIPSYYQYRCILNNLSLFDVDGDGDNDILFEGTWDWHSSCPSGENCRGRQQLINDGTGNFIELTDINWTAGYTGYTSSILPFDADDDGDMDWIVGRAYNSSSYPTSMFINGGDTFNVGGAFAFDRSDPWITSVDRYNIRTFTVIDINHDRFPDLYVGVNGTNRAWVNVDGTKFVNATSDSGGPFISGGGYDTRDLITADFDNDGDLDIIDTINGRNRYNVRDGGNGFVDTTNSSMPDVSRNSYSGDYGDFDDDGFLDVYISNYEHQNELMMNLGGSGFADGSAGLPWDRHRSTNTFVYDFDGDGDLDVMSTTNWDQFRIYVNTYHDGL